MTEGLVYTLVQKDSHSAASKQGLFRFFEELHSHISLNCGEALQESFQTMASLKVLEQSAHRDSSSTSERWFARHDVGNPELRQIPCLQCRSIGAINGRKAPKM